MHVSRNELWKPIRSAQRLNSVFVYRAGGDLRYIGLLLRHSKPTPLLSHHLAINNLSQHPAVMLQCCTAGPALHDRLELLVSRASGGNTLCKAFRPERNDEHDCNLTSSILTGSGRTLLVYDDTARYAK